MTFSHIARVIRESPIGRKSVIARLRLPRRGVGKAILWLIAPAINLERCRIA
jgi:hypothetical protein